MFLLFNYITTRSACHQFVKRQHSHNRIIIQCSSCAYLKVGKTDQNYDKCTVSDTHHTTQFKFTEFIYINNKFDQSKYETLKDFR